MKLRIEQNVETFLQKQLPPIRKGTVELPREVRKAFVMLNSAIVMHAINAARLCIAHAAPIGTFTGSSGAWQTDNDYCSDAHLLDAKHKQRPLRPDSNGSLLLQRTACYLRSQAVVVLAHDVVSDIHLAGSGAAAVN